MTSAFGDIQINENELKESSDVQTNDFTRPTAIYDGVLKGIWLGEASTGTKVAHVMYKTKDGFEGSQPLYYADKSGDTTKNGKPRQDAQKLAGILKMLGGITMKEAQLEQKTIKLYNKDAGKEVPTKVNFIAGLFNKPCKLALLLRQEPKTRQVDGEWRDTTEMRNPFNTLERVLNTDGHTSNEVADNVSEFKFLENWAKKYPDGHVQIREPKNPVEPENKNKSTSNTESDASSDDVDDLDDLDI